MQLTAEQYQTAVSRVLSVLNRFDLLGLEPGRTGGAPDGEYSTEAAALVRVMVKNGEIDFDQVRRTWLEWLGDDLSRLPKAVADDLVRQLNEEFRRVGVE
ncbi:unannotated protein [freshwater metagenome]|uniref:Unannotated protein n=1 Tax=freshwater metagenome TaxID=449393 RepID=A0A6J6ENE9_9ZZZZ|nr:hypothetical protein [Actinomycetota bacterium]